MSGFFGGGDGPEPPKILRSPVEQAAILNQLASHSTPLTLMFQDRNQRFLTYLASVNRDTQHMALDELIPSDGQRMLERGEPFRIDAYLEGVHIYWKSSAMPRMGQHEGHVAAWFEFPAELTHHQKRGAFRAPALPGFSLEIALAGNALTEPQRGKVLDISATGCKVRIEQTGTGLQAGQSLTGCRLLLSEEAIDLPIEVRHIKEDEKQGITTLGLKFRHPDGMSLRTIERYVNQLQREARRREEGELF